MRGAGVTQEIYSSMHKPSVKQLFQVGLTLSGLPCQLSSRKASASSLFASK